MKCRIETSHLRHFRETLPRSENHIDLGGQMLGRERTQPPQLVDHSGIDLGWPRVVRPPMHDPMPDGSPARTPQFFRQTRQEEFNAMLMIRGGYFRAVLAFSLPFLQDEQAFRQPDTVNAPRQDTS